MYIDIETGEIITEQQLYKEYTEKREQDPQEYNYSFAEYIKNSLTSQNGTLERMKEGNTMEKYTVKKQGVFSDSTIAILHDLALAIDICKATENGYILNSENVVIYSNIDLPF